MFFFHLLSPARMANTVGYMGSDYHNSNILLFFELTCYFYYLNSFQLSAFEFNVIIAQLVS